jgi:hypothetical protein
LYFVKVVGVFVPFSWMVRLGNALIVLCLGTGLYFLSELFFAGASYQRNVPIVI